MSLSQLLGKQVSQPVEKQPKEEKDALYNPDIPDDKTEIPDQYYKIYKVGNSARNGSGFTMGKKRIYEDSKREAFSKTDSINPSTIAAATDPDYVPPNLKTEGKFSLTNFDIQKPKSQVNLLKKAHESYVNYLNRFTPDSLKDPTNTSESPEFKQFPKFGMKRDFRI